MNHKWVMKTDNSVKGAVWYVCGCCGIDEDLAYINRIDTCPRNAFLVRFILWFKSKKHSVVTAVVKWIMRAM
jgi:hypothetical protein